MFFAEIKKGQLLSDWERKKYSEELKNFEKNYSIYYKFDSDAATLTVIANKKKDADTNLSDIFGATINTASTADFFFEGPRGTADSTAILLTYLDDKEKNMSEDELKKIYGEDYEKMKVFASMDPQKRAQMSEVRKTFLDLIHDFNYSNSYDETPPISSLFGGPVDIRMEFYKTNRDKEYEVVLELFTPRDEMTFSEGKLASLLNCYRGGFIYEHRYSFYTVSKEDFKSDVLEAFELLSGSYFRGDSYYSSSDVEVSEYSLLKILFALKGKTIELDNHKYEISSEINHASVSLNSKGDLDISPEPKSFDGYMFSANMMAGFKDGKIHLYTFESRKIAKIYSFFEYSGKDSYHFIKDIFAKKLMPTVGSSILKKPEEEDKDAFEIQLYIDLDDNDCLTTKTVYRYGNEEMKREKIPSNPYIDTYLGAFSKALSELGIKEKSTIDSQSIIYAFFKADLNPLRKVAKVFLSDRINRMRITSVKGVSISINKERGWLNASMDSKDYSKEELIGILDAFKKKKKFIILRNDIIMMDEEVAKIKDVADELHMNDDLTAEKLPFFEVYNLKAKENDSLHLTMNKTLTDSLREISNFKELPLDLSPDVEENLRTYQKDAVKWMYALYKNNLDGILADDMGLGKTFETIAFISLIEKPMPILIVCPTSLVYNWAKEFTQWSPSQRCVTIEGDKKFRTEAINSIRNDEKTIYVTSYDSLRNDLDLYQDKHFSLAIIDEAQFIKNAFALKTKAVKKIDSDCRFALTGTPLENRLSDLWSIFDFLMPGYFGSYEKFKEVYENPIAADQKGRTKDSLVKRITPFILRRTKKEVLKSLPPKTTSVLTVNMSELERKFYVAYLQKAREALGADVSKISFLAALTKLREICVDAQSFFDGFKEKSSKLDLAERLVEESIQNGHKILIFSSFSTVLHNLQKILKASEIDSYLIEGSTKSGDRVVMAEDFNKTDEVKVMLVSLKAGGTGLNLMGADTVIHLDPWWNFAAEEQATDRAYRIGQLRPVTVYKLVSYDSVEERVIKLQEEKKALYDAVIQNGDSAISSLKDEDIKFILS